MAATDPKEKLFQGPPVLAVEIISPTETDEDVAEKVPAYLEVGTVVWLVSIPYRTVTIHRPGRPPEMFNIEQEIRDEPYLPGFRVAVARIFE